MSEPLLLPTMLKQLVSSGQAVSEYIFGLVLTFVCFYSDSTTDNLRTNEKGFYN